MAFSRNGFYTPRAKAAEFEREECANCGLPIRRGQSILPKMVPGYEAKCWVHASCTYVAPEQRGRRPATPALPPASPKAAPLPGGGMVPPANHNGGGSVQTAEAVIADLVQRQLGAIEARLVSVLPGKIAPALDGLVADAVDAATEDLFKCLGPKEIVVRRPDGDAHKIDGVVHEKFEEVLEEVSYGNPVYLPGPTGSGKSTLCGQVAKALGKRFGFISCSKMTSEAQLLGRLIPRGENGRFEFVGTQFLYVWERGGLFLLDEMDAADAGVLVALNEGLANGKISVANRCELPEGVTLDDYMDELGRYDRASGEPFKYAGYGPYAVRHPDAGVIAAANTFGRGANRAYVGREPLDGSTLDRFLFGTIEIGYSPRIEAALCPDRELRETMWRWRASVEAAGLERFVSTRTIAQAYRRRKDGWSIPRIASRVFAGMTDDEVVLVYGKKPDWNGIDGEVVGGPA